MVLRNSSKISRQKNIKSKKEQMIQKQDCGKQITFLISPFYLSIIFNHTSVIIIRMTIQIRHVAIFNIGSY